MGEAAPFQGSGTADSAADPPRVTRLGALRGPNIWGPAPVITGDVRLAAAHAPDGPEVQALHARLVEALPGFASRLPAARTSRAAAVAHVAAELQTAIGTPIDFAGAELVAPNDVWQIAVGYHEEQVGLQSVREAETIVAACLGGASPDVPRALARLRERYLDSHPGPTTAVLIEEAHRRSIPVRRFPDDGVVRLGLGRNARRIDSTMTDGTSVIATDITSDKNRTKRFLRRVGLGVPDGDTARTLDEALDVVADIGFPVLLKPLDANNGRGISGRLDSDDQVRAAWAAPVAEHPTVVVERFVEGRDHRVVVVNGCVTAVCERVPAHVVGDGRRTIRELAEVTNRDPKRDPGDPMAPLAPLPLDQRTAEFLARSGRTLETVPNADEVVHLRSTANISTGGTAVDRTDEMHPDNAALCELAADAVGLDIAGIDVLTPDIAVPFRDNGAVIIEVNASPGIRMHTDPDAGTPRNVPGAILDMLYPPGRESTIPVIAVTGTNGKTTTTRLIAHLFRHTGRRVGYTTTDGVYFQNRLLMEGDMTGPFGANVILSNPRVDVAVLETARGGILSSGLGYDACDVAVVLNISADHLGLQGVHTLEQLARVKAVIVEAAKRTGHAVLNADDPLVYAMRERTTAELVLFSAGAAPGTDAQRRVADHVSSGGMAVLSEGDGDGEMFVIRRGRVRIPLVAARDVPLTMRGAARFQYENILAAVAAAYAQGTPYEDIHDGLCAFAASPTTTPGRLNVLQTSRGLVVVDYAHNPAAVRGLLDFAARLRAERRIGVVTMPGDRRDEDLREIGRLSAALDYVIIKEHERYRRGRQPGETARVILDGLRAAGHPADRSEVVIEERQAVMRALEVSRAGDVLVILADDSADVLRRLQPLIVTA